MSSKIRLGTRGSKLALTQSRLIAQALRDLGVEVDLIKIETTGDTSSQSLTQIGGQGAFTKQIQHALLERRIDLAVHSLKDLPTLAIDGLQLAAVPEREDVHDALLVKTELQDQVRSLADLPDNARVGTGSMRRKAQLMHLRKDLDVVDIRGNVDTRLGKLEHGDLDAIVLACAGLRRLGMETRISFSFTPEQMAPAVGQGALGLEVRSEDQAAREIVTKLNDQHSFLRVTAERSLLRALQAGCMAPVGTIAKFRGDELELTGVVTSLDGSERFVMTSTADADNAAQLGVDVAKQLVDAGAGHLINPVIP